jgi:hypothetical protein
MRSAALTWIEPGASATFIWHGATAARPGDRTIGGPIHHPADVPPRRLHPFDLAKETA